MFMRVFVRCAKEIWSRIWNDIKQYCWLLIAFVMWNVMIRSVYHAFCPILIFFGIPCAGCGMTRAIWFILTGQFERGMRLNPAAPLWICALIYVIVMRYLLGKKVKGIYMCLGIVVITSFVIYVYRMLTLFPGNPPLVFHRNCVLEQIFPGYMDVIKGLIG